MQSRDLKADILVPKELVWWTFLAFAADPFSPFRQFHFVSQLSEAADVAIIDSRLLTSDNPLLKTKRKIIVLLWDGYQSYLQRQSVIDEARYQSQQFELHVVGDTTELETRHSIPSRPLFIQRGGTYDATLFSRERFSRFLFEKSLTRLALLRRSEVLSVKAALQLVSSRRISLYQRTRFVYCGQSGMETLKGYAHDYGLNANAFPNDIHDHASERSLLSGWLKAIHQHPERWTNQIILRALLRFMALRRLAEFRGQEIFMNLYPEPNVPAYQAGFLFQKHIFLDFGGINGDEAIYPRAADILFHQRKAIRFDTGNAMQMLLEVGGDDTAVAEEFLSWHAQYVLSHLHKSNS